MSMSFRGRYRYWPNEWKSDRARDPLLQAEARNPNDPTQSEVWQFTTGDEFVSEVLGDSKIRSGFKHRHHLGAVVDHDVAPIATRRTVPTFSAGGPVPHQ
jgi:hypothetical protein